MQTCSAPSAVVQIKTRLEIASEEANTRDVADAPEVVTPEGLRYRDLKIGGGSPPIPGEQAGMAWQFMWRFATSTAQASYSPSVCGRCLRLIRRPLRLG